MKKQFFMAVTLLSAGIALAQQEKKAPPPPPPPKVEMKKFPPPSPPAPPPPSIEVRHSGKLPADYSAFLNRNPDVESIGWIDDEKVGIYLKSGGKEVYDLRKKEESKKLHDKYGELPACPPSPPAPPTPPKKSKQQ